MIDDGTWLSGAGGLVSSPVRGLLRTHRLPLLPM